MNDKILCVDDEINVLQGYKRTLRKDFDIYIAEGGRQGLTMIAEEGPFAVVVSDMRMPGMDGVQFLSKVKEIAPDSIRIMLTGNSDQQTAMDAVNEGNIFRFLNKPCSPETFEKTLKAALGQYRLVTAEKQLLEHTLNKSLQVLVDILAIVNTTAFTRSSRIKKLARQIAERLEVANPWEVEIAAMLSQIGCVSVPEEILQKINKGERLSEKETALYQRHPQIGHDLVVRIPRMETVAEIIANQNIHNNHDSLTEAQNPEAERVTIASRILKVVFDYDKLINSGSLPLSAFNELESRIGLYDALALNMLGRVIDEKVEEYTSVEMRVSQLKPGMILDESVITNRGVVLLTKGQDVSLSLVLRLSNFADAGMIKENLKVCVPVEDNSPLSNENRRADA